MRNDQTFDFGPAQPPKSGLVSKERDDNFRISPKFGVLSQISMNWKKNVKNVIPVSKWKNKILLELGQTAIWTVSSCKRGLGKYSHKLFLCEFG